LDTSPTGSVIDGASGLLTWTPGNAHLGLTNQFTVRVQDDGAPPLTDTKSFSVFVVSPPTVMFSKSGATVTLRFLPVPSEQYQAEYNNELRPDNWQPLGESVTAQSGAEVVIQDNVGTQSQRFYRIRLVD
jgi:hypothetical protein